MNARTTIIVAGALALLAGCSSEAPLSPHGLSSLHVEILSVNGQTPPTADHPLPPNHGDTTDTWAFTIEARSSTNDPVPFDGLVRLSTRPGAIVSVTGDGAVGRNIKLTSGKASGVIGVTAAYGPSRLWVEDIGYNPAPDGTVPACSSGVKDPDAGGLIDYPAVPGCAFANDTTERGGTYAAGVSGIVQYALPTILDMRGRSTRTPYPFEAVEANTAPPQRVIVTRVASDGFYVSDVSKAATDIGYNGLFAFNFSTPPGMRVCDRVTYLAGTLNDFFGFTELSFPSYRLHFPIVGVEACEVPEPTVLDLAKIADAVALQKLESDLVRIQGFKMPTLFGSKPVKNATPTADASSCDLNGDGVVDFTSPAEGACAKACQAIPECSEWTTFSARGELKVSSGTTLIQINTGTVPGFDATAHKGETLDAVTGTMRKFSGGTLNWTIETRCADDLVCQTAGCVPQPLSSQIACVRLRTQADNDQGSN